MKKNIITGKISTEFFDGINQQWDTYCMHTAEITHINISVGHALAEKGVCYDESYIRFLYQHRDIYFEFELFDSDLRLWKIKKVAEFSKKGCEKLNLNNDFYVPYSWIINKKNCIDISCIGHTVMGLESYRNPMFEKRVGILRLIIENDLLEQILYFIAIDEYSLKTVLIKKEIFNNIDLYSNYLYCTCKLV